MVRKDTLSRQVAGLRVVIERTVCIGSGSCVSVAPEVFDLDSELLVTFAADGGEIERERLLEACEVCPVEALRAYGDDGKQLAP